MRNPTSPDRDQPSLWAVALLCASSAFAMAGVALLATI
jgi:hypothetical protein